MSRHVVVLGGGACGLSAAWELAENGQKVTVIERGDQVGGLAGHVVHNGNNFEFGTHVFHTGHADLKKRVIDLMGPEMFPFNRGSKLEIKFHDKYYAFPLNGVQVVRHLPLKTSLACIASLVHWLVRSKLKFRPPINTEEYLIWHFGKKLYEVFFQDYTHKFWGVGCAHLDPKFGQDRIPRSDIFRLLHDLIDSLGLEKFINRHELVERTIGHIVTHISS